MGRPDGRAAMTELSQSDQTVSAVVAELLAAGDAMAKLIADGTAGRLEIDMAALSRWARAVQRLRDSRS
jgi:hypothetical protein